MKKEELHVLSTNTISEHSRFWIGVVSASHVKRGMLGGFAQLNHGKAAPLRRMSRGDWLIYYSPRTDLAKGTPLQAFTAIGQVADSRVYTYQMSESFVPFRRNISYIPCREVKIADLLDQLSFTRRNPNWGYSFRYGHFEIGREDFLTIAGSMLGAISR
ncbi:EVE domain-containing protein [Paenibacillus graminis]|uniref:EVE domain-containing protein n=1 Tax=Paenibacillus graminis TaxID=189425 RepID=UPI000FA700AB|nr:EVE domain-containing protein [Paenibacillus graminis]MEC0168322.1 EVE domain-containing protein [Paenibacillus graminis]